MGKNCNRILAQLLRSFEKQQQRLRHQTVELRQASAFACHSISGLLLASSSSNKVLPISACPCSYCVVPQTHSLIVRRCDRVKRHLSLYLQPVLQ
jgi:hypothetical protein